MIDKIREIEQLLQAYEATDMEVREFADEFFEAVRMVVKLGIPCREQRLSVRVPHKKQMSLPFENEKDN
jgi:hypothetical protein